MKKVIVFVQFIFMMFFLSYGYAQTSSNTASESIDHFDFIRYISIKDVNHGDVITFRYPELSFSVFSKKIRQVNLYNT